MVPIIYLGKLKSMFPLCSTFEIVSVTLYLCIFHFCRPPEIEDEQPYSPPRFLPHTAKLHRSTHTRRRVWLSDTFRDEQTFESPYTPPRFLPRTSVNVRRSACVTDGLIRLKALQWSPSIDKELPSPLRLSRGSPDRAIQRENRPMSFNLSCHRAYLMLESTKMDTRRIYERIEHNSSTEQVNCL